MNHFLLTPRERVSHWTQFRKSLKDVPEPTRIREVAAYFSRAPLKVISVDPFDPTSWPTPWEMISEGEWCRHSVAIGMEQTLRLSGMDANRMRLSMIRSSEISDQILVLQIDRLFTLNYGWGEVIDRPLGPHRVIGQWGYRGRSYAAVTD